MGDSVLIEDWLFQKKPQMDSFHAGPESPASLSLLFSGCPFIKNASVSIPEAKDLQSDCEGLFLECQPYMCDVNGTNCVHGIFTEKYILQVVGDHYHIKLRNSDLGTRSTVFRYAPLQKPNLSAVMKSCLVQCPDMLLKQDAFATEEKCSFAFEDACMFKKDVYIYDKAFGGATRDDDGRCSRKKK